MIAEKSKRNLGARRLQQWTPLLHRLARTGAKKLKAAVLLGAVFVLAAAWLMLPDTAHANLSDNLVGYWRFDEGTGTTAADQSSTGNNGTLVQDTGASPSWVSPGRNNIGSALQFDGAGTMAAAENTVNVGNDASLDAMGSYILSAWVKFEPGYTGDPGNTCNGNKWSNIVGRNSSTANWSYMLYINGSNGTLRAHHKQSGGGNVVVDTATVVPTEEWVHLAQVADGNRIRVFINGVEDTNSLPYDGTMRSIPTASTYIGQDNRECTLKGQIDDVSIHNTFAAPGGVYGGLEYWLRTDDMELTGGIATNWDDVYGWHTNEVFTGGANITLGDGFNFHNTARFNAGYLSFTSEQLLYGAAAGEVFSMVQTLREPNVSSGFPYELGGGGSPAGWAYQYPPGGGFTDPRLITGTGATTRKIWAPLDPASGPPRDVRDPLIFNELSRANEYTARFNGLVNFTDVTNTVNFNSSNGSHTYIGASHNSRFGDANLSEVIAYRKDLSQPERERVQSYMAVQYGMTLGTTTTPLDYKASDGSNIWNGSPTYQNDIAGIGRDDTSLLSQKQSKSENPGAFVTIGNGTIAADNASNPNNFANDLMFLMWGDDAQSTDVVNDIVPVNNTQLKRMQRIWSVQNVGDALGTLKIQIPQAELAGTLPKMLISNSETFDDTAQQIDLTAAGGNYEANITLSDGQFFTFAVDMVAPEVTTDPADTITQTSATLHGTLDDLGDFADANVFFRYRIVGSGDPFTETAPQTLNAPGAFSAPISGLALDTQYEFKTVVQWQNAGTQEREGSLLSFVTDPADPPDAPINLQAVSAGISQINLTWDAPADEGGSPVTGYKIERSLTGADGWTTVVGDTGSTSTTYPDTGLGSNTEYFYRVSAINDAGTGSPSNIASATTDKLAPQTTTDAATAVADTSATLNGTLDPPLDFTPVDVFFRYRVQGSADLFTKTTPQQMASPGAFNQDITSLDPETTYEFKAVVQWNDGGVQEAEGSLLTFTTLPANSAPQCDENNVDCFVNPVTSTNVILEVDDACTIGTAAMKPQTGINVADPAGFQYPLGLMDFNIDCGTPGYTTTVTQYYYDVIDDTYILRKYNPNAGSYFTIESASIEQTTLNGQTVTIAEFQVTDGGQLDIDGEANGTIVDPAGLALSPDGLSKTGQSQTILALLAAALVTPGLLAVLWSRKAQ